MQLDIKLQQINNRTTIVYRYDSTEVSMLHNAK